MKQSGLPSLIVSPKKARRVFSGGRDGIKKARLQKAGDETSTLMRNESGYLSSPRGTEGSPNFYRNIQKSPLLMKLFTKKTSMGQKLLTNGANKFRDTPSKNKISLATRRKLLSKKKSGQNSSRRKGCIGHQTTISNSPACRVLTPKLRYFSPQREAKIRMADKIRKEECLSAQRPRTREVRRITTLKTQANSLPVQDPASLEARIMKFKIVRAVHRKNPPVTENILPEVLKASKKENPLVLNSLDSSLE